MKILFVDPCGSGIPPLGLLYLISIIKQESNHEVEFISLNPNSSYLRSHDRFVELLENGFDVVGITSVTPTLINAIELAKEAANHGSFVILGGPGPTNIREKILEKHLFINLLCFGESEKKIIDILNAIDKKTGIEQIPGLMWCEGNQIKQTKPQQYIMDLDSLYFPERSVLLFDTMHASFSIITSRGCPYNCSFCFKPVHGRLFRARSPENVIKEIKEFIAKFPEQFEKLGRTVVIADDSFNFDIDRAKKIFELIIEENLNINLTCVNGFHVGHVDFELMQKYKKAGGKVLWFGCDSGSEQTLKYLGKGITLNMVRNATNLARKAGIEIVGVHFILGLENETLETARETINFAKTLNITDVGFDHANVLPGTRLWDYVQSEGKLLYENDGIDFRNYKQLSGLPVFETPQFTKEERMQAYLEASKAVKLIRLKRFISLKGILNILRSIHSAQDIFNIFKGLKKYLFKKDIRLEMDKNIKDKKNLQ